MVPLTAKSPFSGMTIVALAAALILAVTAILLSMGRSLWCRCGSLTLWSGDVYSEHTSQHLLDWYSTTHIVHGLLLYGIAAILFRSTPVSIRFLIVLLAESVWEIAENSPLIIERYRAATIALNYYGDSVINSLSDIGMCAAGFAFAERAPTRITIALGIALELFSLAVIRDNLTLNILMLIWPIEAIKVWQGG